MSPYRQRSAAAEKGTTCLQTIIKLLSQFEQVERATPFARRLEGKTSLGIAHGTGPTSRKDQLNLSIHSFVTLIFGLTP